MTDKKAKLPEPNPTVEQLAQAILREPPKEWEYLKRGKEKRQKAQST